MIIDCILDRQDLEMFEEYIPHDFYLEMMKYGEESYPITRAMDNGDEENVKKALCDYIDRNDYNPTIKDYINSVEWL